MVCKRIEEVNRFEQYLDDKLSELRVFLMICIKEKIIISSKYKFHFNKFMLIYLISILIIMPIVNKISYGTMSGTDVVFLISGILFIPSYQLICIEGFLKLKTLIDYAKENIYEDMPDYLKKHINVRYIVENRKIDVSKFVQKGFSNLDEASEALGVEAEKYIKNLTKEEKETAMINYLEKSKKSLTQQVYFLNSLIILASFYILI